jgi:hypothetical protein
MPYYTSYVLRVWQVQEDRRWVCRAMLEKVATGERIGFADLAGLVAFLQADFEAQAQTETMTVTTRRARGAQKNSNTGGDTK